MPHNGWGPSGQKLLPPRRPERAIAIAVLGLVLFLKPFLGIFDKGGTATFWGVPLLYAYLFGAWTLVIVLTAIVMENRSDHAEHSSDVDAFGPETQAFEADDIEQPARSGPV